MADVEVAVIGAGPNGLSVAARLRRIGIDVKVFGEPLSFWRAMPKGLLLRSNMSATSMVEPRGQLSLPAYMASTGERLGYPVSLGEFIAYGTWVQQCAVPDVDRRSVRSLDTNPVRFTLTLDDGAQLVARRVVMAAGVAPFAGIPDSFADLPSEQASHTAEHTDMSVFAGRTVAVIGGGQSAFECAALMHERGARVEVLVRSDRVVWLKRLRPIRFMGPVGPLVYAPTDVGPLWYSRLVAAPDLFRRLPRDTQTRVASRSIRPACSHFVRARLEGVKLTTGTTLLSADPVGARVRLGLSDGSDRLVDHVMFGTGYPVDVSRYAFLSEAVLASLRRVEGYPVLRQGLESSVEGLHVMGAPAAWSFGPIMRFVSGSWYAGSSVAGAIRESRSGRRKLVTGRI